MKFSYQWLKEYIPQIPPVKMLAENLMMKIFEVEGIEEKGEDDLLDIDVLANRAFDCLSHLGMAREIAAIEDIDFKEPEVSVREDKSLKAEDFLAVEIKEPKLCQRYSARVVVDVTVGESPDWLKQKLEACGLRSINNIVDITNFVMLECGQPLHAFDLDKIGGQKIIVRRAASGEQIDTLDEGKGQRILNENILVIADAENPIAIAGIKGGRKPEISAQTKRVALEAANFDPVSIRKSSKVLNLRTDASVRFENRLDKNLTIWSLDRAASLMAELAGGKVAGGIIDVCASTDKPYNSGVKHSYIENLIGAEIESKKILDIFRRLSLKVLKSNKKDGEIFYELLIPPRRADLGTPEDLIEEIARLYGYENIPAKMPAGTLLPALKSDELVYTEEIRNMMTGLGFMEVYNYSFVSEQEKDFYQFRNLIEVLNPLSQEQKYLRPSLAAGFIRNLKENIKNIHSASSGIKEIKLFEIEKVFSQSGSEALEEKKLGGIIYIKNGKKNQSFYEAKGIVETMLDKLALEDIWEDDHLEKGLPMNWDFVLNPRKTSQIKVGNETVGLLGAVNPEILGELEIEGEPVIFEIDLARMFELIEEERGYVPPSPYPAITRDISLLVDAGVKIDQVFDVIENVGGELLEDADLFDIYDQDEDIEGGRKSLGFHLVFQSGERNLTDAEVNEVMEKIIKAVEGRGWEVRK